MNTGISKMYEGLFDTRAIFVSDYPSASDIQLLKSLNITAVVTVARQFKLSYPTAVVPQHLSIPARDVEEYDIEAIFDDCFEFIERVHKTRNVLIHCGVGVSRSVAVFIAYLIKKHGYSLGSAFSIAKRRRPIINPNKGFIRALEKYSEKHSCKDAASREKGELKLAKKNTKFSLQRRLSLREQQKQHQTPVFHKQKSTLASSNRDAIEDLQSLSKVLEQKQKVEEKLKNLQAYYRSRKEKPFSKLNSCFESKKEGEHTNLFQTFAQNFSAQL